MTSSSGDGPTLDAIILAEEATSRVTVAGLTARERAVRVARRVGAARVFVVETSSPAAVKPSEASGTRDQLVAWRAASARPLLVIRADQLVHTPLVDPLVKAGARAALAIAVGPDGRYAGALLATGDAARDAIDRLARGETDTALATAAELAVPHGEIARHAIGTAEERRDAHRLLYQLMVKSQDNAITRYMYRPFAAPLTKLLVWTPITPNQISYTVAALCAIGCWLTLQGSSNLAIAGAGAILLGCYFDCCDGEIARLKLMSSRMGAWIDTVVDELATLGYMIATGYYCHLVFGPNYFGELGGHANAVLGMDPWIAIVAVTTVLYGWCIYAIYYNIIVAVGSANSQDYVGRFEVAPGTRPNSVRLRPKVAAAIATPELPKPLQAIVAFAPNIVRRDFICWFSFVLACLQAVHLTFAILVVGGWISAVVLAVDHIKLRRLRRSIVRAGQILESPAR